MLVLSFIARGVGVTRAFLRSCSLCLVTGGQSGPGVSLQLTTATTVCHWHIYVTCRNKNLFHNSNEINSTAKKQAQDLHIFIPDEKNLETRVEIFLDLYSHSNLIPFGCLGA